MLDTLVKARNDKVSDMMAHQEAQDEDDPLADNAGAEPRSLKRPRQQLYAYMPEVVDIEVETEATGKFEMRVLSDWYKRAKLFIELSPANVQVLLDTPVVRDPDEFVPVIACDNVLWNAERQCIYTRLPVTSGKRRKYRSKPIDANPDPVARQVDIDRRAVKLQEWYDKNAVPGSQASSG